MMLDIDGTFVIYEGLGRLRWSQPSGANLVAPPGAAPKLRRIVDRVWPDRTTQAHLRRQIEHGQKVVVILDASDPVVSIRQECLPTVPVGAVVRGKSACGTVELAVPHFTWLSPADRARGEAFSAFAQTMARRFSAGVRPPLLVEGSLVGTGEPLRFVFESRAMTIDVIRQVITHLYTSRNPTTMHLPATAPGDALVNSMLRLPAA
ncbi:MAG: hypothetical protein ABWZ02_04770 [Nakamurella sp.]